MEFLNGALLAALFGFGGGAALGLAARLGDFCTFGAIEAAMYGNDQRRLRMWGVVLGVAILGTYGLAAIGQISIAGTIYHQINWSPVASITGGLIFGYGMALAGNCGFGALTRLGGGDLRSLLVVIVIAIAGFFTLSGPLAGLRVWAFPYVDASGPQGIPQLVDNLTGFAPIASAAIIALAMIVWAFSHEPFRKSPRNYIWAVVAGVAIVSAFWGTSYVNDLTFDEVGVQGHTFTAPLGRTLLFLMTSSGGGIGFPVGSVTGVLFGSFLGALYRHHFRWEACEDPRELGRQVMGAAMMGVGGVLALGCSVGQGASAFATLSFSAPVTLGAIVIGASVGLRQLITGFHDA